MYESHIESLTVLCGFVSHLIDVQILYCIFLHLKDSQQVPVPHKAPHTEVTNGHSWYYACASCPCAIAR